MARDAEKASQYLAEGQAELDAMLGMEAAKREIKRIRSTTKVNLARSKVGLRVPVTSRHTLAARAARHREDVGRAGFHQAVVRA